MNTFDTLLRDPVGLDQALLQEAQLTDWTARMVRLASIGTALYGVAVGLVWQLTSDSSLGAWPVFGAEGALPAPIAVPLALVGGLFGALAVCLPSFWFYTQLAGLDASFRFVTAQALRVQARTAVLLLGCLPLYLAFALSGTLGFDVGGWVAVIGIGAPFVVGFFGVASLYTSFRRVLPQLEITHERRGPFLLLMVAGWGLVYSTVAPVAVLKLLF